jgi:DNA invertase Pin-like site-specific DNA recombinase
VDPRRGTGACLADLRPGDTLVIWRIDRLGRNLRDLIDIVTTLQARAVGVRSLSNGLVDTTTAHGALVSGMFALMAEYEAALIRERTQAGLAAARARGRKGGRKPKMTPELVGKAQRMYDARQFTMAEIAASCAVTPMTIYRNICTGEPTP